MTVSRRQRLGLLLASAVAASCAFAVPSFAADLFADASPVPAETLQSERAGFFVADGLELGFAATLETTINGQLALVTSLTLQDDGSVTTQTTVNPNLSSALGGSTVVPVDGGTQLSAVTGLDLGGVRGSGVVVKSASGITAVLDNLGTNQLQNLVINTANNQAITQTTAVTLTLPGFSSNIGQFQASQVMAGLDGALQFSRMAASLH
jgi:hypothetical protein